MREGRRRCWPRPPSCGRGGGGHGRRAARRGRGARPDAVLTDIRMPPTHTTEGIDAAKRIRRQHRGRRRRRAVAVRRGGLRLRPARATGSRAWATCSRSASADVDDLVHALREVARGGSVLDPRVVERLLARGSGTRRTPLDDLTDRGAHGPGADGRRRHERDDRQPAVPVGARGREEHQHAVQQAGAERGDRGPPPGPGRPDLPARHRARARLTAADVREGRSRPGPPLLPSSVSPSSRP